MPIAKQRLFQYLTQRLPIKYWNKSMLNHISYRTYGKIPNIMRRSLPILSRSPNNNGSHYYSSFCHRNSWKFPCAYNTYTVRRRYYGNNHNEDLLERLRNGQITKGEVQRLILAQQQNNQNFNQSQTMTNGNSKTIQSMTSEKSKISPLSSSNHHHSLLVSSSSSIGTKTNPLYMKRQTSIKEFIFSLFPFLFIFWMLGGFDMVKNRKQGGVGGMFGNNYSEWDEEDWEEDEIENEDMDNQNNVNLNENDNQNSKEKDKKNQNDQNDEEMDRRTAFFKKLGIDLETSKDESKQSDDDQAAQQKKERKKRKRVRFKNVCGNEEAKIDLQDLVDYLKNPQKYQKMGCKLPKGVLMAGPPGTGKTLLARAVAGEAGVPFLATNGASFDEIFVGVGVMRVRKLFERAKERAPCIIFIDEIDAIANTRMQMGTAHSSDSLNALLSEMDGFEQNSGVIVIAATNMADRLDAALVRPGRFDRKVHLQLPDKKAREEIVELYLGDRGDDTVNIKELVGDISGFSGAELESMVNLASIECVKEGKEAVSHRHLIEAKEIISMGRARKTMDVGIKTKRVTAYHEGGHAIVSLYTKGSKPVYKATILPRGGALGFVASVNEDEFMMTKMALLAQMDVCMGGRAAEEVYSGSTEITTGASSDFNQATRIATAMVTQYGMSSKIGRVYYKMEDLDKLSPELQNVINKEVRRLLDESYQRAKNIILSRKKEWNILAEGLLERETLSGEEIRSMIDYDESQKIEPIDVGNVRYEKNKLSKMNGSISLKRTKKKDENNIDESLMMKQHGAELLNPNI